jgi:hypothetical protein
MPGVIPNPSVDAHKERQIVVLSTHDSKRVSGARRKRGRQRNGWLPSQLPRKMVVVSGREGMDWLEVGRAFCRDNGGGHVT